ncbi:glycerophosphoryl diester phosphodiesterase [Sagittula marina]|uniref:Glycerophosphoryl diester phosphodiesterase n=1 Tax=Sagittula marina TaxID=943940 RepID=A0A7W6DMJ8_9RHOB|nr:glycerophosphodiester phosphodiesterase family protein [Sagittula marina]MBB3984236.1 glycerophosphoryl diester phosphodiesterase [Sagittula marina]
MPILPDAFLATPIAHRALHDRAMGRPENSRAAIRAAIAAGYGIEIDLQLSADGQAMVFHDYDLSRLTGDTGPLRQRDAAALGAIHLSGTDEGIPTLADVLTLVAGQVPLLIELKDQDGAMGPDTGALERATSEALTTYDGPAALMSFNPHTVRLLRDLCPDRPVGLTTCAGTAKDFPILSAEERAELSRIALADEIRLAFISHDHTDLTNPRVKALHEAGLPILCWTIRTPEEEAQARQIADNVTFEGYAA